MSFRPCFARIGRPAALCTAGFLLSIVPLSGAPEGDAPPPSQPREAQGDLLVTFPAPDLDGQLVDVAGMLAGRPALVVFWATWCQPCIAEIPKLRTVYAEFRSRGLVVLGIGLKQGGETADKQRRAAMRHFMDYPLVHDADDKYQEAYQLTSLPLNLLVDRSGVIRYRGPVLPADVGRRVAVLLAEGEATGTGRE